jgi:hypothetical protein
MSRRSDAAAVAAANAASEAARTLQARSQEVRQENRPEQLGDPVQAPTKKVEPRVEVKKEESHEPRNVEKMLSNRPHTQAMEEILKKREEQEGNPPVEEAAPVEEKAALIEAKKEEIKPDAVEQPKLDAPAKIKLKVDGEEHDVDPAEVEEAGGEKGWRIAKAQENRLKKINEAAAESRAREERMLKLAETITQQNAPKPQPQATEQQFIAERLQKIRFGTDEEGAQALIEAARRLSAPAVDSGVLVQRTTANMKYEMAEDQFKKEFQDIASNPMLVKFAKQLEGEKLAPFMTKAGPDWGKLSTLDWGLLKRTIGNEVRSAFGRQSQPATTTDKPAGSSPTAAKEERKASIVNLPTAAARADLPKEEKEPTPDEARKLWLAETKKKRGQG